MANLMRKLWRDDCGALISSEYLFVATILVIGIVVGLTNVEAAINAELTALGDAFLALNVGYTISGQSGSNGSTTGSEAININSQLNGPVATPPSFPVVISVPVN